MWLAQRLAYTGFAEAASLEFTEEKRKRKIKKIMFAVQKLNIISINQQYTGWSI